MKKYIRSAIWRKRISEAMKGIVRPKGENSTSWKGEEASYFTNPQAKECSCEEVVVDRTNRSKEYFSTFKTPDKECICPSEKTRHNHCPTHGDTHEKLREPDDTGGWEEKFDKVFAKDYYGKHGQGYVKLRELTKAFITDLLEKELERVFEAVERNIFPIDESKDPTFRQLVKEQKDWLNHFKKLKTKK